MRRIKAGILGCTGLVGQHLVLRLSSHPFFELSLLAASKDSAGKTYSEAVSWSLSEPLPAQVQHMQVQQLCPESLVESQVDVFFSALPSSVARKTEEILRKASKFVFSNASAHRLDPDVALVIADVNPDHLALAELQRRKYGGFIVTNSNCVVAGVAPVLAALSKFEIRKVILSTYQSVSGAGFRGLKALQIMDNLIPFIEGEEEKIKKELGKILGRLVKDKIEPASLFISASCCRVPVKEGHLISLSLELERANLEEVREALSSYRGLAQKLGLPSAPEKPIQLMEGDRPQPALDRGCGGSGLKWGMAVSAGRLRREGNWVNLFLLVHNLVRGAAGSAVLNAELCFKLGLLGGKR